MSIITVGPNHVNRESPQKELYGLLIASFKEMSVKREREFEEQGKWM
jgi:hypothetical protein